MPKAKTAKQTKRGQQTRQGLVDAALLLFKKRGYDRVTVDDICAKVGVTKGAFYSHFRSKDQIVAEEFFKYDEQYLAMLQEVLQIDDHLARALAFGRLAFAGMQDRGVDLVRTVLHGQLAPGTKSAYMTSWRRPIYGIIDRMIKEGQEHGAVRADLKSGDVAEAFIALVRGILFDWCSKNGKYDLVETGTQALALMLNGIRA